MPRIERQHREHHELVGGVVPIDVETRIRLGVSLRLCLAHSFVETKTIASHSREHVVARAVDDSIEPLHAVACKGLAQDSDHGYPPAHRPLEGQIDAVGNGSLDERRTAHREKHLVRGHDTTLRIDGALDIRLRRAHPPQHLDVDIDRGVAQDCFRVRAKPRSIEFRNALLALVTHEHADDLQRRSNAPCEGVRIGPKESNHTPADCAAAQQAETNRFHCWSLHAVSPRRPINSTAV